MESLNGVNAITIVFAALCIFAIAYRFYGLWVAQKVLNINAARETPANRFEDGKDYVPTNKYVLFGHHFAAIAAAGPLLGPVLAAQFGYLPGLLWILIGCVLAAACTTWSCFSARFATAGSLWPTSLRRKLTPLRAALLRGLCWPFCCSRWQVFRLLS